MLYCVTLLENTPPHYVVENLFIQPSTINSIKIEKNKSEESNPCLNNEENRWISIMFEGGTSLRNVMCTQDNTIYNAY